MNHAYLSKMQINEALINHEITKIEAEKLIEKIESQKKIYKNTHK